MRKAELRCRGERDQDRPGRLPHQVADQFSGRKAIDFRKPIIHDNCIVSTLTHLPDRVKTTADGLDFEARLSQGGGNNLRLEIIIFDDQDAIERISLDPFAMQVIHLSDLLFLFHL
jgi:hypothetical protein